MKNIKRSFTPQESNIAHPKEAGKTKTKQQKRKELSLSAFDLPSGSLSDSDPTPQYCSLCAIINPNSRLIISFIRRTILLEEEPMHLRCHFSSPNKKSKKVVHVSCCLNTKIKSFLDPNVPVEIILKPPIFRNFNSLA